MARTPAVARLNRRRLVDDATQSLRHAILSGRLGAGARLRQMDLAARLGISRTPIRDALGRLEQEGLIELLPHGGVRVTPLNAEQAVELYDLREVLDGLAARLAAGRAEPAALGRLGRARARMARCIAQRDPSPWFPAHVAFHEEIVRAADNRPLLLKTERRLEDAYREHRGIFEAIAAHDGEAAERLARVHISNAKEIVLKVMAQGERNGAVQD